MLSKSLVRRINHLVSMSYAHGREDVTAGMGSDPKEIREYARRASRTARDALVAAIEKEFKAIKKTQE